MLDKTDQQIVDFLKDDARINNKAIAQKMEISEGTVRNRIKRLVDEGKVKLSGLISPDEDKVKQIVMLGVNLSVSKDLEKKAEEITSFPEVKSTLITTGRYDLIVELWVDVKYGLIDFISKSLSKVDGVVATESFVIMKSYDKWI